MVSHDRRNKQLSKRTSLETQPSFRPCWMQGLKSIAKRKEIVFTFTDMVKRNLCNAYGTCIFASIFVVFKSSHYIKTIALTM